MLLKINYNMKYIKLFEDFNEELDIYDAKQIVISHLGEVKEVEIDDNKWNSKEILILELLEEPTDKQIEDCEKHLFPEYEEKGFFLHQIFDQLYPYENKFVVGIGRSIEDYCISWLNSNYSDMESVDSKGFPGTVLYRYEEKDNVLLYDDTNSKVYVNTNIFHFFVNYFGLDEYEIEEILDKWVKETYKLDVPTTRFGNYYGRFEKCV